MASTHHSRLQANGQPNVIFTSRYDEQSNDGGYGSDYTQRPLGERSPSIPPLQFEAAAFTPTFDDVRVPRIAKYTARPPRSPARPISAPVAPSNRESYGSTSSTSTFEDAPLSPLPSSTLKRSSHIRRKGRPQTRNGPRASRFSLSPIITDFSSPPPLSPPRLCTTPPLSDTPSTPSPKAAPDACESPCQDSPRSSYSAMSARGASIYVEWDTTGYLQPVEEGPPDIYLRMEDDEQAGGLLKRQKTDVIANLLRERHRRAGLPVD